MLNQNVFTLPSKGFSSKLVIFSPAYSPSNHISPTIAICEPHNCQVSSVPSPSVSLPLHTLLPSASSSVSPVVANSSPVPHTVANSRTSPSWNSSSAQGPVQSQPAPLLNTHPMVTRSKVRIFKTKVFLTKVTSELDSTPADNHEAMLSPYWSEVVHSELSALLRNNTWSLCDLPPSRRLVGCKLLFKVKKKPNGSVGKYKARLVAKGFL